MCVLGHLAEQVNTLCGLSSHWNNGPFYALSLARSRKPLTSSFSTSFTICTLTSFLSSVSSGRRGRRHLTASQQQPLEGTMDSGNKSVTCASSAPNQHRHCRRRRFAQQVYSARQCSPYRIGRLDEASQNNSTSPAASSNRLTSWLAAEHNGNGAANQASLQLYLRSAAPVCSATSTLCLSSTQPALHQL